MNTMKKMENSRKGQQGGQGQAPQKRESEMDKLKAGLKDYMKEDDKLQGEGNEYGGLMKKHYSIEIRSELSDRIIYLSSCTSYRSRYRGRPYRLSTTAIRL